MRKFRTKGFTLVELIVVLVILVILVAVLVTSLLGYVQKAHDSTVNSELRDAATAAQSAYDLVYAKYNLSDSDQVLYSSVLTSEQPFDKEFASEIRTLLGNDAVFQNIQSIYVGPDTISIFYARFGKSYSYLSTGGTVTISKT